MSRLSLDHLQTFAHVVASGSFSAAAQRLKLSQPAISLQMKQLEGRLGVRLIDRVGRRASATAAGEELLSHARRVEGAVTAALEAMSRHAKGTAGRVRLGTGATACIYFLPPILRSLRNRFPELDIVVNTGSTLAVLKSIEENSLDMGLVTLPASGRMFDIRESWTTNSSLLRRRARLSFRVELRRLSSPGCRSSFTNQAQIRVSCLINGRRAPAFR